MATQEQQRGPRGNNELEKETSDNKPRDLGQARRADALRDDGPGGGRRTKQAATHGNGAQPVYRHLRHWLAHTQRCSHTHCSGTHRRPAATPPPLDAAAAATAVPTTPTTPCSPGCRSLVPPPPLSHPHNALCTRPPLQPSFSLFSIHDTLYPVSLSLSCLLSLSLYYTSTPSVTVIHSLSVHKCWPPANDLLDNSQQHSDLLSRQFPETDNTTTPTSRTTRPC